MLCLQCWSSMLFLSKESYTIKMGIKLDFDWGPEHKAEPATNGIGGKYRYIIIKSSYISTNCYVSYLS